jgi:hypothetical protein
MAEDWCQNRIKGNQVRKQKADKRVTVVVWQAVAMDSLKYRRPTMPDLSTSCGRATPETALWPYGRSRGGRLQLL